MSLSSVKSQMKSQTNVSKRNPENAKALLEPYLKEGKDILHIAFSSALSGTYNSSRIPAALSNNAKEKCVSCDTNMNLGGILYI